MNQYLERSIVSNAWESASSASSYLSDLYSSLGDKELSEAYLIRSLSYAQKSGSKIHKSNMMNNRAMQYFFEGKLDSAEIFFKSSLKVRGEVGHAKEISESHFNLSVFYLEKGEWIQSIEWAEKGEHFAEINGLYQERKDLLELLMEAYMKLRENEKIKLLQIELEQLEAGRENVLDEEVMKEVLRIVNREKSKDVRQNSLPECVLLSVLLLATALVWRRTT